MRPTRREQRERVTEKQEQAAIVKLLRLIGAQVYVLGTKRRRGDYQGTMQTPGLPDLFAFLPVKSSTLQPRQVWIEVKRDGGKVRTEQRAFEWHCAHRNIEHVIGTADDVTGWLKLNGFVK